MGSLRYGSSTSIFIAATLLLLLPACGGHKPPGASPFPAKITLNPASSYSIQVGTILQLTATAQNGANSSITPTFTFASSNPGILDVAPNGGACAGTWNAPLYSICTPAGTGTAQVTASALGATSAPTIFFVHPQIDNIQISVAPPVTPPPPACPAQTALPAACNIAFKATNLCLSANQTQTLQATAFSQGNDITALVGPFNFTAIDASVVKITPIVDQTLTVATNQISISPATPGQTQIVASASGVSSQPYPFIESCPVSCIDLSVAANGSQETGVTSFLANKGTNETITATAVDVQGCIVPKPSLTWVSTSPAALTVGSGCSASGTCTVTTAQPGTASITASCTPPTCNAGFPLNLAGYSPPYIPQPIYPVTAISGLVTGATTSTNVLVSSQDCGTDPTCSVAAYSVSTSTNVSGNASQIPTPPNSVLFDPAGDKAYMGSNFGALSVTPGSSAGASAFASITAPGTPLGLVTGKVLAVSPSGTQAIFSDTVSTPNQVYVTNSAPVSTTPLNINNAIAATFSPDGLSVFILGNGGTSLYVYSSLQFLQPPITLPTPATSIVFSSTGSFAVLAGGSSAGNIAAYNTCDISAITLSAGGIPAPPLFLKMVPAANVPAGNTTIFGNPPVALQTAGLDFFFGVDNTGIDIIATTSSPALPNALCPQQVGPAVITPAATPPTYSPIHIDIGQGTFHPIKFFLSPDSTQAYIITSDFGVLIYNFNTHSTHGIPLINNAVPLAADITVDGSLIYVAGSDGLLHILNIALGTDQQPPISFNPLPNSPNSFCYTGANCAANLLAVKP
jgi:hypothetical protein